MTVGNYPSNSEIKYKKVVYQDQDVIDFKDNTYKIAKLCEAIANYCVNNQNHKTLNRYLRECYQIDVKAVMLEQWFKNGIDCEVLQLGSEKWQKAKIKLEISIYQEVEENELEFNHLNYPNSELDDIRLQINKIVG